MATSAAGASGVDVAQTLDRYSTAGPVTDPRKVIGDYLRTRQPDAHVVAALATLSRDVKTQVEQHGSLRRMPAESVQNVRNDMYLASETIRRLDKDPTLKLAKPDAGECQLRA
jgi:PiT family inorganic phosphate transporter